MCQRNILVSRAASNGSQLWGEGREGPQHFSFHLPDRCCLLCLKQKREDQREFSTSELGRGRRHSAHQAEAPQAQRFFANGAGLFVLSTPDLGTVLCDEDILGRLCQNIKSPLLSCRERRSLRRFRQGRCFCPRQAVVWWLFKKPHGGLKDLRPRLPTSTLGT